MDFALTVLGLAALVGAGDALVRGAVALSLRLGISALIVSLTVVAFGTSAPELLIGAQAALQDADGIVFGNVVGSNICNVLLVLGVPALIRPLVTRDCESRRSWKQMIGASLLFVALVFLGPLTWWHGLILIAGLAWMLWDAYSEARAGEGDETALAELEDADPQMPGWRIGALIAVGVVGLPLGAHLLIEGARGVAVAYGVSEAAIGLTLVALGTSLPELVTTVMATIRRQADVALGNVIGSNLFNILAIMGIVSFLGPLDPPPELLRLDLWVMLAAALAMAPFVFRGVPIGRLVGAGFVLAYLVFAYVVLVPRM